MDEGFKKYIRTIEMRDIFEGETKESLIRGGISISKEDLKLAWVIFKDGKIARNPQSHKDKWYVNAEDVKANFKLKQD